MGRRLWHFFEQQILEGLQTRTPGSPSIQSNDSGDVLDLLESSGDRGRYNPEPLLQVIEQGLNTPLPLGLISDPLNQRRFDHDPTPSQNVQPFRLVEMQLSEHLRDGQQVLSLIAALAVVRSSTKYRGANGPVQTPQMPQIRRLALQKLCGSRAA